MKADIAFMTQLNIDIKNEQKTMVLFLKGSADMNQVALLERQVSRILVTPVSNIIIDLSDLMFICSMGLSSFIRAMAHCRKQNGQLLLVNPQARIQKILRTTRLDQILPIYATLDEARSALTT